MCIQAGPPLWGRDMGADQKDGGCPGCTYNYLILIFILNRLPLYPILQILSQYSLFLSKTMARCVDCGSAVWSISPSSIAISCRNRWLRRQFWFKGTSLNFSQKSFKVLIEKYCSKILGNYKVPSFMENISALGSHSLMHPSAADLNHWRSLSVSPKVNQYLHISLFWSLHMIDLSLAILK